MHVSLFDTHRKSCIVYWASRCTVRFDQNDLERSSSKPLIFQTPIAELEDILLLNTNRKSFMGSHTISHSYGESHY